MRDKTKTEPPRFYMPGLNARLGEYEAGRLKEKRELVRRLYQAGNSVEDCARKSYSSTLPPDESPDFDSTGLPTAAYRLRQCFKAYLRKCEEWVEDLAAQKKQGD